MRLLSRLGIPPHKLMMPHFFRPPPCSHPQKIHRYHKNTIFFSKFIRLKHIKIWPFLYTIIQNYFRITRKKSHRQITIIIKGFWGIRHDRRIIENSYITNRVFTENKFKNIPTAYFIYYNNSIIIFYVVLPITIPTLR